MRTSVCLFAVLVSATSFAVDIPALPESSFADTEVSTNIAFSAGTGMQRIRLSVDMQATPSNNVEIAVGRDADNDGRLSLDEAAITVGYDCGEWFVRSAAKDSHRAVDVTDSGRFCRAYEIRARHIDRSWNLVKVTRRGFGVTNERVAVEPTESGFALRLN